MLARLRRHFPIEWTTFISYVAYILHLPHLHVILSLHTPMYMLDTGSHCMVSSCLSTYIVFFSVRCSERVWVSTSRREDFTPCV
jgi:hypothetical protein